MSDTNENPAQGCYACMVGVATGPESHDPSCRVRNIPMPEQGGRFGPEWDAYDRACEREREARPPVADNDQAETQPPFQPGDVVTVLDKREWTVAEVHESGTSWKVYMQTDNGFGYYVWANDCVLVRRETATETEGA